MGVLNLIFPQECFGCRKEGVYFCTDCAGKAQRARPICPTCQRFSLKGFTHKRCQGESGLEGLTSVWAHEGGVRKIVLALKYKFAYEVAKDLGENFSKLLRKQKRFSLDSILVPIPLHSQRKNWRGFNQVEEVAKVISKNLGYELIPDLLIRIDAGKPQIGLKRVERLEGIKGVFAINPKYKVRKERFLLLDDVWTTGATLKEGAKTLKLAGAKRVWGLTLARGR